MAMLEVKESKIKGLSVTEMYPRAPHRAQGFLSLPDEIICMIARNADHRWWLNSFSRTCRKIRRIITHCPDLWSHIDSELSNSFNEICLTRSQNSLLDVNLCIPGLGKQRTPLSWQNFITLILRHSPRWKNFTFYLGSSELTSRSVLAQLNEHPVSFPKLQSFTYDISWSCRDDHGLRASDNFHFYCSWLMPNLIEFEFHDFIPRAIQVAATSIKVYCNSVLNTALLLDFFRANPQIRNLSLDLWTCTIEPTGSSVTLDGVETLSVNRSYYDTFDLEESVNNLMSRLQLPNVANLKFHMDAISFGEDANSAINSLLSGQERFGKLAKLELEIIRLSGESYNTGRFLTKLPNLKELSIDASYEDTAAGRFWDNDFNSFQLPNLDCVKLDVDANFFDEELIFKLLDATKVKRLELVYYPSFLPRRVQLADTEFVWHVKK